MQRYNQIEPRFSGTYSRNSLLKNMKDTYVIKAYVINLDEYINARIHWIPFMLKRTK